MLRKIKGLFSSNKDGKKKMFSSRNAGSASFRRFPVRFKDADDASKGKHFEYFADMWDAILGDVSRLESMLEAIVENGDLRPDCRVAGKKGKAQMVLLQYPKEGEVRAGAFLAETEAGEGLRLISCYPVLEGMPNHVMIKAAHTWSNGMEGDVTAYGAGGHIPMTFHAPFFFRDSSEFTPGAELMVDLGALALSIEPVGGTEWSVEKKALHKAGLERFLRQNPDKTEADFLSPVVSVQEPRRMLPTKHACEWKFHCPVLAVKPVSFQKTQLYRMTVAFVSVDGDVIAGYLYASQHILQGCVPKVGDDVEGVLWMTGSLSKFSLDKA